MKKFKVGDRVKHYAFKGECIIVSLRAKAQGKLITTEYKTLIETSGEFGRDRDKDIPARYVSKLGNTYWYCCLGDLEHVE